VNGNAIEQDGYHGENIARLGNVVYCSVNHRLGALGYTHLKAAGSSFAASGNVGNLDLVAALEWVKNNIANFGGDPNNVTIIGQSGGGAKVTTLMNMPSAKGLFHKAVALSGSSLAGTNKEYAEKLGLKVMEEAGLKPGEIRQAPANSSGGSTLTLPIEPLIKWPKKLNALVFNGAGTPP